MTACFWAFWGSIENFHEGWFAPSFWQNLGMMFVQYLSPMLATMLISLVALRWPRLAVPIVVAFGIAVVWFFQAGFAATILWVVPLLGLGVLYCYGDPQPRAWAWKSLLGLPILTALICGAYPGWRAIYRLDDGQIAASDIASMESPGESYGRD